MQKDLFSWIITGLTLVLLISPLFILFESNLVIFLFFIFPIGLIIFYFYFALPRSKSKYNQFENLTIAHRGGRPLTFSNESEEFPENSLAAFRWASKNPGINAIELDVWLSKDNVPMINHDQYLGYNFAACQDFISSLTCEQLKKLKYLKRNKESIYQENNRETMATLEEVIILLKETNLKLMIEIKENKRINEMSIRIDQLFKKYPFLYERSYCASFNPRSIYAIRKLNPSITTAFLYISKITSHIIANMKNTPRPVSIALAKNFTVRFIIDKLFDWFHSTRGLEFLGADLLCISRSDFSLNLLDQCRKKKIIVCVWTVNQQEEKQWLTTNGVTVITDTLF